MSDSIYDKLSRERKAGQEQGKYPHWYTTGAYQMFKYSYEYQADGLEEQLERIVKHLAKYSAPLPSVDGKWGTIGKLIREHHGDNLEDAFFSVMWKNHFQLSTPALANTGTDRGCSVSCSGTSVSDSVGGFFDAAKEIALLSKNGFGTSAYLGDVRGRGVPFKGGGKATGSSLPKNLLQKTAGDISQGSIRRGAVAEYLPIDHPDFDEWCDSLRSNPEGQNIGWNYSDEVIRGMGSTPEYRRRHNKVLATRMNRGKGYIWKPDVVNRLQPSWYPKKHKASNLCTEICLYADESETYTCIISSMNALNFDEYKDQASVFLGVMILDAMANEFIESQRNTEGLEKAVRYTENWKSLGLGVLGFASYLQSKMVPWMSFEADLINTEIFSQLQQQSVLASQYIYEYGIVGKEMVGHGQAHSHLNAIAPNLSSSVLAGQVSQGIEPWLANAFMQDTASGSMVRINPQFLKLIEGKGLDVKKVTKTVIENKGSLKGLDKWFSEDEIEVFATAFEIPQERLIDLAAARQSFIDQGQSLNLFFSAEEDPKYIAQVHQKALLNPWIKGLYYCRSESGVQASKNVACESCAS